MQSGGIMMDRQEIEARLKKIEEEKQQLLAKLPSWCKVLGIEYKPELEDEVSNIERAVELKDICDKCEYNADTCKDCAYGEQVCSSKYLKCDMYAAYREEQHRIWRSKYTAEKSGLGKRFIGKTLDAFEVTSANQKAYDACKAFCENYSKETTKGLKLFGNYGSGKTHLVSAIIHKLGEQMIDCRFMVVPELLRSIRQGFSQDSDKANDLVKEAERAHLLILDDLGAEKTSDWVREQLYIIINRRYENMLPTIVTTNCTTAELVERLGERTVSRLIEMTDAYKITADDYRLKKE
jgi:DNA replication protein DnaC